MKDERRRLGQAGGVNIATHVIDFPTLGAGLHEATEPVLGWLAGQGALHGLLTVVCRHTSASLLVQGRDEDMKADLEAFFVRLAPLMAGLYTHQVDGPDDMPAHIPRGPDPGAAQHPGDRQRARACSGQGVYLFEHRAAPQRRHVLLQLIW